ncbi:RuBisCO large subunit C-terminal-like domain-containing protein [Aliifodinibius sp. S!AR15-10]|uniref:RuBisCO large subunit C-terminal-like domain-containing protein n=1 Tax=Aliifodinibius sp. S!AR15-10 TaxID=2950437 RepID=UPI00285E3269|nr:RuBisCO large subunit C-terminal-like domain-containing protein [Aliifodinibius sp. S!AR15-10]MDR8391263.1 RuBisCO large subunit C-terminal-like domain-containing protein [Aliifodinibius sp. S!AR15-10]
MQTFTLTYRVRLEDEEQINEKVENICLEQSVELPLQVLSESLADKIVGQETAREQIDERTYRVKIGWPTENIGREIANFINIMYGNISLQPGIRITDAGWEALNGKLFEGPAMGIEVLREKLGITGRALSSTALKPVGKSPEELAELCYKFASGGIDIIKDDHGLANQSYAPFEDRVKACVNAVGKAAEKTGCRSWYFPNITALASDVIERYELAAELGADGVLLCPHIAGLATMHQLARMETALPVMAHPAFSGSLTTVEEKGLTPDFLYGQLWRALGADFVIYPNVGGRFSFTLDECRAVNNAARNDEVAFRRAFPVPAGGLKIDNIAHWIETYGSDTVFLIGSSLYKHPEGIESASNELRSIITKK